MRFIMLTLAMLAGIATTHADSPPGEKAAQTFIEYWNAGDARGARDTELFTEDFLERRGPGGLARIMGMVYGDNGDITLHEIISLNDEHVTYLVSSEQGNWLQVDLDFVADGRVGSAGGGGYASANDMLRFAKALYAGTLVDAEHREIMTTFKVPFGDGGGYAYLYMDGRVNGQRFIGHNGGAPGINAEFAHFPELGYTLVVLANLDHAASPIADKLRTWIGHSEDAQQP